MQRHLASAFLAGLTFLLSLAGAQERAPGVQRLELAVEVDCGRAREIGWGLPSDPDARVVELAAALVRRRFEALERAARVTVEPAERRLAIALPSIDSRDRELLGDMLRNLGLCEILFVADEATIRGLDLDLAVERAKLETWQAANSGRPLAEFNVLSPDQQGPHRRLTWAVARPTPDGEYPPWPMLLPADSTELLGAASFENLHLAKDRLGFPSVVFDIRAPRQDDFARLTAAHQHHRIGFLVGDALVAAPTLEAKLRTSALIEGRFTDEGAARWLEALRELRGPLQLVETR